MGRMDITAQDLAAIPARNLHVPREDFAAVWVAAERYRSEHPTDWYSTGVAVVCRWLAGATVRPATGAPYRQWAPVTRRHVSAYEELIEQESLEAERLLYSQPPDVWVTNRPGWLQGMTAMFNWAWARRGPAPSFGGARRGAG
jgi:hypothetical protein